MQWTWVDVIRHVLHCIPSAQFCVRCEQVYPVNGITQSMKIAAGICGAVGPAFMIGYFAIQTLRKKNN